MPTKKRDTASSPHEAFMARIKDRLDALAAGRPALGLTPEEKRATLAELRARIEASQAARAQVVERFEDEIRRLESRAMDLERQIEALEGGRKRDAAGPSPAPGDGGPSAGGRKRGRPRPTARRKD